MPDYFYKGVFRVAVKPIVKGNDLNQLFVDYTTNDILDFPCMFVLLKGTVLSAVFKYSYRNNDGTNSAVTSSSVTKTVTSFDLVVNGYVVSRKRYGNPGKSEAQAYKEARELLQGLMDAISSAISGTTSTDEDSSGLKITSINKFPVNGSTYSLDTLAKASKVTNV